MAIAAFAQNVQHNVQWNVWPLFGLLFSSYIETTSVQRKCIANSSTAVSSLTIHFYTHIWERVSISILLLKNTSLGRKVAATATRLRLLILLWWHESKCGHSPRFTAKHFHSNLAHDSVWHKTSVNKNRRKITTNSLFHYKT